MDPQPPNTTFTPGWSAFSADWFTARIPQWKQHIVPALAGKPCRWLELGSYEGRSAIWTMDNVLTHSHSHIVCVDLWSGEYEKNFDANIAAHPRSVDFYKRKGDCFSRLLEMHSKNETFDGIYIDADHQAKAALTEAALCWPMLKKGGFMIFDDYPWQHKGEDRKTKLPPKPGIDAFLECWQHELRLVHKQWQVIVQKL